MVPIEVRRGHQIPEAEVTDGYELSYGFWGQNLDLLQKQQVHLTPESSLQPPVSDILKEGTRTLDL